MSTDTRDRFAASLRDQLAPRQEILDAYLFGSRARADDHPHSDVDVAIFLEPSAASGRRAVYAAEIAAALAAALGTDAVDVVVLNDASPLLYHRVLRDGVRLLARDLKATTVREGRALSRYCDYVPQLRKIEAAHRGRIAAGAFGT